MILAMDETKWTRRLLKGLYRERAVATTGLLIVRNGRASAIQAGGSPSPNP